MATTRSRRRRVDALLAIANSAYGPEASLGPDGEWPRTASGDVDALVDARTTVRYLGALRVEHPRSSPEARHLRRLRELREAARALGRGDLAQYEELARALLARYAFTLDPHGEIEHGERGWDAYIVDLLLTLVGVPRRRLKVCRNRACRWAFVDTSNSGRRVWCDMATCGNRHKVARFRGRQRRRTPARSG